MRFRAWSRRQGDLDSLIFDLYAKHSTILRFVRPGSCERILDANPLRCWTR